MLEEREKEILENIENIQLEELEAKFLQNDNNNQNNNEKRVRFFNSPVEYEYFELNTFGYSIFSIII